MEKLPTAKELFDKMLSDNHDTTSTEMMITFAKMHVEAALKVACEEAESIEGWNTGFSGSASSVDKNSILNSYPLENIK